MRQLSSLLFRLLLLVLFIAPVVKAEDLPGKWIFAGVHEYGTGEFLHVFRNRPDVGLADVKLLGDHSFHNPFVVQARSQAEVQKLWNALDAKETRKLGAYARFESLSDVVSAFNKPNDRIGDWGQPAMLLRLYASDIQGKSGFKGRLSSAGQIHQLLNRLSAPQIGTLTLSTRAAVAVALEEIGKDFSQIEKAVLGEALDNPILGKEKEVITELWALKATFKGIEQARDKVMSTGEFYPPVDDAKSLDMTLLPSYSRFDDFSSDKESLGSLKRWMEELSIALATTLKGANLEEGSWINWGYSNYGGASRKRESAYGGKDHKSTELELSPLPLLIFTHGSENAKKSLKNELIHFLLENEGAVAKVREITLARVADEKSKSEEKSAKRNRGLQAIDSVVLSFALGGFVDELSAPKKAEFYRNALEIYEELLRSAKTEELRELVTDLSAYVKTQVSKIKRD